MERSRQNVRGGELNMATVHHLVPDGAPDGTSRVTNHALSEARASLWEFLRELGDVAMH